MSAADGIDNLTATIGRYNDAWNGQNLEAIVAMHAPDMVREGLVVQEWTASGTHSKPMRRGDLEAAPTGRTISWDGIDSTPFENGLVKRKDVYSDSVSILRQVGLLD